MTGQHDHVEMKCPSCGSNAWSVSTGKTYDKGEHKSFRTFTCACGTETRIVDLPKP